MIEGNQPMSVTKIVCHHLSDGYNKVSIKVWLEVQKNQLGSKMLCN